jgi:Cu(I)/Ag(I) efflux system membrane fusion protein
MTHRDTLIAAAGVLAMAGSVHGAKILVIEPAAAQAAPARPASGQTPLYYQDPTGKADFSPLPKKDAQGRDYVPVYDDAGRTAAPKPATHAAVPGTTKKILYYRNPMGLADTSPVPKKDSMNMDYIPVYEDDGAAAPGTVKISLDKVQKLGVRTELAMERAMTRSIRAVGTVALDERRMSVVNPKFEGWIDKLYVNTTGQAVRKGQALAEIYSPDLVLAQQEYLIAYEAMQGVAQADTMVRSNAQAIADAALSRLRHWDISNDQLVHLAKVRSVSHTLTLYAASSGLVMDKQAVEGMHFAVGDTLFRIADLSTVWAMVDIFEQDLAAIQIGQAVQISVAAYPDRLFTGKVAFIYPSVNKETRTARLRIEIPNRDQALKADMYVTAEVAAPVANATVLTVPNSAILDGGKSQIVLVELGDGRYQPKPVQIGRRADGYTEIRSGLASGDKVVVGANFLIDAESNLRAALQAFTAPPEEKAR